MFLNDYDVLYDGSAGLGGSGLSSSTNEGGIHTGDILRGVWIYNESINNDEKDANAVGAADGMFVLTDGLKEVAVQELVRKSAFDSKGRECHVLVERDDVLADEGRNNQEQRHICKQSSNLLSMGKYWSYDYFLK
jgi:hypothetical protein